MVNPKKQSIITKVSNLDQEIIKFSNKWFDLISRISLFVVYFWFGLLKLVGLSPASPLAEALTTKTLGLQWFDAAFTVLAILECIIGILILFRRTTRLAIGLMVVHMALVCSPLVLVRDLVWRYPLVPTLEGQYIIKNIALLAVATTLASKVSPYDNKS